MDKEKIRLREGEMFHRSRQRIGGGTRGLAVLLRVMGPLEPASQCAAAS